MSATEAGRDRTWDWLAEEVTGSPLIVHGGELPEGLPEAEVPCCMGAAAMGRCTCWREVYDHPQRISIAGPITIGPKGGCADCAYRPDSPERQGSDHVSGDQRTLDAIVVMGAPFTCHQGIKRVIGWQHPTLGFHPNEHYEASYRPEQHPDCGPQGRPWPMKADGSPADLCWGWADRRYRLLTGGDR